MMTYTVIAPTTPQQYDVTFRKALPDAKFAEDLLRELGQVNHVVIVTDSNVGELYGQKVKSIFADLVKNVTLLTVPAGEASKRLATVGSLAQEMLLAGVQRRGSVMMALGGGMIGDLTGFVASTYMRGIPFVQLPTSLLAMVDASIGGKTGVDTDQGKNLIGTFYQPRGVFVFTDFLETLPVVDFKSGLAELIKHACIADAELWQVLAESDLEAIDWTNLVERAAAVKVNIVNKDEKEHGVRAHLNLGHTVGHAIEHHSGYKLSHGYAVAIGMIVEAQISKLSGNCEQNLVDKLISVLRKFGLPVEYSAPVEVADLWQIMRFDKKNSDNKVRAVLPCVLGEKVVLTEITFAEFSRAWSLIHKNA